MNVTAIDRNSPARRRVGVGVRLFMLALTAVASFSGCARSKNDPGTETKVELSALGRIEGVRDVCVENGDVTMQVTALHQAVPALLNELERQGVALTGLRTRSATLEDVFVALTGRHLRDA